MPIAPPMLGLVHCDQNDYLNGKTKGVVLSEDVVERGDDISVSNAVTYIFYQGNKFVNAQCRG